MCMTREWWNHGREAKGLRSDSGWCSESAENASTKRRGRRTTADPIDSKLQILMDYHSMVSQRVYSIEAAVASMSASICEMKSGSAATGVALGGIDQIKYIEVPNV